MQKLLKNIMRILKNTAFKFIMSSLPEVLSPTTSTEEAYGDISEQFAISLHQVKRKGVIRISCTGNDSRTFNYSMVIAAIQEAKYAKGAQVIVIADPIIVFSEDGFNGLLHLQENKTIDLYQNPSGKIENTSYYIIETENGLISSPNIKGQDEKIKDEFDCLVERLTSSGDAFKKFFGRFGDFI